MWGWFPLAYVAFLPLFLLVQRATLPRLLIYGPLYGLLSYSLFNSWLITWHPLAIFVVPVIYAAHFLVLLPVLWLIDRQFPKWGYLLQAIAWIGYEYIKTRGYLGYPYGIIGYSQVLFVPLIQVAELAGVWIVSLIVIFPSVFLAGALRTGWAGLMGFLRRHRYAGAGYLLALAGAVLFGYSSQVDYSESRMWRVALVQQNIDPWRGGNEAYRRSLEVLLNLSREAVKENPEIVIWSETSFVPSIDWHTRYRTSDLRYKLVKRLRDYLDDQDVSYLIGNNDGQKRALPTGQEIREDYNATLLYRDGEIIDIYRKLHLVPFSEHFPFGGVLTWMRDLLQEFDIHFYSKGRKAVVFEDRGVRFSTPICFEDIFGYLGRRFVNEGAEVLVNMTNDAWSGSVACQMQHMTMAVFRAVENRRSLVRSTNGGMTVTVDPNGRITAMLEPFVADYLVAEVPVFTDRDTFYSRTGDWLGIACLWMTLVGGLGLAVSAVHKKLRHRARR
jgi:apolipoprotein N-acyltransferase